MQLVLYDTCCYTNDALTASHHHGPVHPRQAGRQAALLLSGQLLEEGAEPQLAQGLPGLGAEVEAAQRVVGLQPGGAVAAGDTEGQGSG